MKSKRWFRRNRHTRPEWVKAYKFANWINRGWGWWYPFIKQSYGIAFKMFKH